MLFENLRKLRICWRGFASSTAVDKGPKPKQEPKQEEAIMVIPRSDEEEWKRKRVVVTLLGCNNPTAHITALCIKLKCKEVKEIRMWGSDPSLRGTAMDLSHLATYSRILSFVGKGQLQMALRGSDIVMMMGGAIGFPRESTEELFCRNMTYLREMTNAIITHSPRALVGICVKPIMPSLSFFSLIQRLQGISCPKRIFGVMALEEMRACTLAAVKLGLPPGSVKVKLTGGATSDTVVPVVSSAHPGGDFLKEDLIELMNLLRGLTDNLIDSTGRGPHISRGYAVAKFIMALAKGSCIEKTTDLSTAVRNTSLFGVPYLTLPVTVGYDGIVGTTGIPKLTNSELRALIRVLPAIVKHITIGEEEAVQGQRPPDDLLDLYQ